MTSVFDNHEESQKQLETLIAKIKTEKKQIKNLRKESLTALKQWTDAREGITKTVKEVR